MQNPNPNQDPRAAYAQMAAAMQQMGPNALDRIKKEMRKRVAMLFAGAIISIVALFIDPKALGWPIFVPSLVMIGGGALSFLGMLGPSRGSSCMAQITAFFWLLGVGCGVGTGNPAISYTLAGAASLFALLALFLPKPKKQGPLSAFGGMANMANMANMAQQQQQPQSGGRASLKAKPRARDRVIDISAEEK